MLTAPWLTWIDRYNDIRAPRILVWTGSPSDVSRVDGASAYLAKCNSTDSRRQYPLTCFVTHDRSLLMESDAIVFHADLVNVSDLPRKRASSQLWVFWARTHPAAPTHVDDDLDEVTSRFKGTGTPSSLPVQLAKIFNWTMAHREDAYVRIVHKSFVPNSRSRAKLSSSVSPSDRSFMQERRDAAWIASACELEKFKEKQGWRRRLDDLVDDLGYEVDLDSMTQIDLQILPNCGAGLCKSPIDCVALIAKKFKFIVVASTPACFESVDDLVYEAFKHDIVPVVLASPNFELNFPPKSVFSTTEEPGYFHEHLRALLNAPALYETYFNWKQVYTVTTLKDELCPLCHTLHEQRRRYAPPGLDYREWWERRVRCRGK
ncbi:hypothetical protein HPB52_004407 [Rhipicephalus sanguineus]|uniref:Fucosyltransferase n=2 Tax=Rhipicephalus sanguineus TaxID=34632 RepID=A0A9D4T117_RHISA|nr:hypothetical protein HPB52_004407 [Rhipicephalus sanguineus]